MCACIYVSPPEYMGAWFLYIYIYLHIWLIIYVYLHTLRAYNMFKYMYITAPKNMCAWFVQQRTAAGPLSACSLICQSLYTYEYTYMTAPIIYAYVIYAYVAPLWHTYTRTWLPPYTSMHESSSFTYNCIYMHTHMYVWMCQKCACGCEIL